MMKSLRLTRVALLLLTFLMLSFSSIGGLAHPETKAVDEVVHVDAGAPHHSGMTQDDHCDGCASATASGKTFSCDKCSQGVSPPAIVPMKTPFARPPYVATVWMPSWTSYPSSPWKPPRLIAPND